MRVCYFSRWRLTRDSDELRKGFYYWAPKGTPSYPGAHTLGSRRWNDGQIKGETALGEWAGAWVKHRGDPPALIPSPVMIGEEDCIASGERSGLTEQTGRSPWCHRMLPLGCYPGETEIDHLTNWRSCMWAVVCAKIIKLLYEDIEAAKDYAMGMLGGDVTAIVVGDNGTIPSILVAKLGHRCFVWVTGTAGFMQAWHQGLSFGQGPAEFGTYAASPFYEQAARAIIKFAQHLNVATCTRWVFSGHSYGGAAAYLAAVKVREANRERRVEVLTFGAPKCGDQRLADLGAFLRQMHYVIEDDPVPFTPPQGLDFDAIRFLLVPAHRLQWARYVRYSNQWLIGNDDTLTPLRFETVDETVATSVAVALGAGLDTPTFESHRSSTYLTRLAAACPCTPPLPGPIPEEPEVPPFPDLCRWQIETIGYEYDFGGAFVYPHLDFETGNGYTSWDGIPGTGYDYWTLYALTDDEDVVTGFRLNYYRTSGAATIEQVEFIIDDVVWWEGGEFTGDGRAWSTTYGVTDYDYPITGGYVKITGPLDPFV